MTTPHRRIAAGLALLALVSACAPRPPVESPADPAQRPYVRASSEPGIGYDVQPASSIVVKAYRGGTLARLGHNHVIATGPLSGRVIVRETMADSSAWLAFDVTELQVDDAALRRAAGDDFPGEIPAGDIAGTRRNMLSEPLLDAAAHPELRLELPRLGDGIETGRIDVYAIVKGVPYPLEIPLTIERSRERVRAYGSFALSHGDIGLTPFSVMLGALAVQDELEVDVDIVAVRPSD